MKDSISQNKLDLINQSNHENKMKRAESIKNAEA
jgi:hypothetical protein